MIMTKENPASTRTTFHYVVISILGLLILSAAHQAQAGSMPTERSLSTTGSISSLVSALESTAFVQRKKRSNPLRHQLASGLKVKGIKLTDNMFLTKLKSMCGHRRLALSINVSDVLYQLGTDRVSMTIRF